jgi:signal transduction histidine kinase
MTTRPVEARRAEPPESEVGYVSAAVEPLVGISSPLITAAARRVAQRVREDLIEPADVETAAALLAAIALAVDRQHPSYVTELVQRATPTLGAHLVELLRTELLRGWAANLESLAPAGMVATLEAIERVREAIEPPAARHLAERLAAPGGLDLVVEIAHDLRSPLTSILFLSETLQTGQSGDVNEVQRHQLALIYSAALGLSALVSNAIELARGGERLVDQEPCPFSITQTLEAVRDMVRPMAEEKGLSVHMRPSAADLRIGHPVALSRALLNLTCNALKFTEHGFVEVAAVAKNDERVEFSVRDTGAGIDPQALNRLYQPFRRVRGRSGFTFSGTGLGLAITRKLITAMGSDLQVETGQSWGTRFFFEVALPLAPSL